MCHSRWLTTALRFCRIWVSKHGLKGKLLKNLRMIIEFIVGVYMPNWINIKVNHKWMKGPKHVLYQLEMLKSQQKEVVDLVMPTIKRSAWYAHSESVLQAMLCSDVEEERREAVNRILETGGVGDDKTQLGDSCVRPRRNPDINPAATTLSELIDWSTGVTEPPLTCSLTTAAVKELVTCPMVVPDWPSPTQSLERCVKMRRQHMFTPRRSERDRSDLRLPVES